MHLGFARDTPGERAKRLDRVDEHVLVAPDTFEAATREQERFASNDGTVPVVDVGRNDQVHLPKLILQKHEDDAIRSRRTLPRDCHPRNGNPAAVLHLVQLKA